MFINSVRRTMRSHCGHGGANRCAGEVRASAPIRALVAVIAALFAVLLVPTIALADSSVIWGPSAIPNAENGIVVNAADRYRAAAVALGYSDSDIETWSDDVLAKLSNQSTGGNFYEFAQLFGEIDDAIGSDNPLTAVVSAVGNAFWAIAETLYGDNIWIAGYSSNLYANAASDLSRILAGDNIGGGSGAALAQVVEMTPFAASSAYYMYPDSPVSSTDRMVVYKLGNTSYYVPMAAMLYNLPSAQNFKVKIPASEVQHITDYFNQYPDGVCIMYMSFRSNQFSYGYECIPANTIQYVTCTNVAGNAGFVYTTKSGDRIIGRDTRYFGITSWPDTLDDLPNTCYDFTQYSWYGYYDMTLSSDSTARNPNYGVAYAVYNKDGLMSPGDDPVVPPSNWPDEPSAPSPPELPEPGTNPTVTPTPWAPVISPTFDFDLNITTEPTSNDLIDWVKKIYFELRSFHSDEQDWFDEVGKGIDGLVDAIDDAQEQIYGELQNVDETLRSEGQKIRDYMYRMFHWLKDQLNFQNDSFNDSNIVYWLKRIWSKLGNGDINLRPTDPTNDPDDWWDWLVKAIQNFLIGLAATSTELISEIADLASQVMHEFPFSIPWDIAAVLAALSTAPVTPVITVTIPAISGWWNTFDFVIDMHPFDGAAETIRLMEKLLFTGFLIWKSKELLDFMDVTKWFN